MYIWFLEQCLARLGTQQMLALTTSDLVYHGNVLIYQLLGPRLQV